MDTCHRPKEEKKKKLGILIFEMPYFGRVGGNIGQREKKDNEKNSNSLNKVEIEQSCFSWQIKYVALDMTTQGMNTTQDTF